MAGEYIKMGGASVSVAHILSFSSEKEFVEALETNLYQNQDAKSRKAMLKSLYKIAQQNYGAAAKTADQK